MNLNTAKYITFVALTAIDRIEEGKTLKSVKLWVEENLQESTAFEIDSVTMDLVNWIEVKLTLQYLVGETRKERMIYNATGIVTNMRTVIDSAIAQNEASKVPADLTQKITGMIEQATLSYAEINIQAPKIDICLMLASNHLSELERQKIARAYNIDLSDKQADVLLAHALITISKAKAETGSFNVFSFRAECISDVEAVRKMYKRKGTLIALIFDEKTCSRELYLKCGDTLAQVRNCLQCIPDGHHMVRTVQQCHASENTIISGQDHWLAYNVINGVVVPLAEEEIQAANDDY